MNSVMPARPRGGDGPVIEVRDLHKSYGRSEVLKGVDLEVHQGEVLALLGPNGAGKTTTIEILEGYRSATSGAVRVLGLAAAGQPSALRARIGVVLQECGFPSYLKVGEILDAQCRYFPNPRHRDELLELVELRDEAGKLTRHLSGGQRRRLDLALALAGDPELVFLDEPTTGFDPEARQRCWSAIENLRALGKTVLLTTHYLDEAERLSDRVAVLFDGQIAAAGTVGELGAQTVAPTTITFRLPLATSLPVTPPDLPIDQRGGLGHLETHDAVGSLERLLSWARKSGLDDLDRLTVSPPTLEQIYLQLTADRTPA